MEVGAVVGMAVSVGIDGRDDPAQAVRIVINRIAAAMLFHRMVFKIFPPVSTGFV